ncbi:MAG: glucose-1-phosphate adenylyltransferase subunit GlgD [Clostridia bacterium]|nr:glucose-1-phosphate adenylyltransferase subunit GlgD [Clostridia bacterium]
MNALGIVFCDHYYSEKDQKTELTRVRTPASVPFGGRFRLIDFTLSDMVNAQIKDIGVIAKENYGSLIDHLDSGAEWDLNRRRGGLTMLTPLSRPENRTIMARGRLDALRAVKGFIKGNRHDLVVMTFGGTVANIDLAAMMEAHVKKDAYITIAYSEIVAGAGEMILQPDQDGRIKNITYLHEDSEKIYPYAIGAYVMNRKDLLEFLDEAENNDYTNMNRELIQKNLETHRIFAYQHIGYARILRQAEDYYSACMDMLKPELKKDLFTPERPIYTKVKDSVPTFYDFHAQVENSLIADGCTIKGTVRNSVIFRGVTVEEGAVVEDSILMQNTKVGKDARVCRVIADKDVLVGEGSELRGAAKLPFIIGKGREV